MAQYIKNANIFGRIGSGLGQGLAEQLPKEIEHYRRKSDLDAFANEVGQGRLSPIQQVARASSIYGATPQMIQSLSEQARMQNTRNAYNDLANSQGNKAADSADSFQPQAGKILERMSSGQSEIRPGMAPNRPQTSPAQSQQQPLQSVGNENALNPAAITKPPWTQQQRNAAISGYNNMGFSPDRSVQLAADDEARDLAMPGALAAQENQISSAGEKVRKEFDRQLEQKLEKSGKDVFKDLSGEMKSNMERGVERDLRENPNAKVQDVANKWSNRALQLAKTNSKVDKIASTTGFENLWGGDQVLKDLKEFSKIYAESGSSEEYKNKLIEKFDLSDSLASSIAFDLQPAVKSYIKDFKPINFVDARSIPNKDKVFSNSRKAAIDIEKRLSANDSLLSISRALAEKDPNFDQQSFFEQLREDRDLILLNDRQKLELGEGATKNWVPTWGDVKIGNWTRRPIK